MIQHQRPLAQFAAAGAVHVAGNGQTVSINFDSRYQHEWSELERRLTAGDRVLMTPANGNCGLFAVYMGFHSLAQTNGWTLPTIQAMRNFLHPGPPNPAYWHFVYERHGFQPTFLESDYTSDTWFSSSQLDLLTEWLAHSFAGGTRIRNVYVCQEPGLSAEHRLILGQLEQTVNEQLIFIYYTRRDLNNGNLQYRGNGQAVFPNPFPVVGLPTPANPVKGPGQVKPQYTELPSDDCLLYITGRLRMNPQTLAVGQVQIPVSNKDLQARFQIRTASTISHRVDVARKSTTLPAQLQPKNFKAQPQVTSQSRDLEIRWPDMIARGVFFEPIVRPTPAIPAPAIPGPAIPAPPILAPSIPAHTIPAPTAPLPRVRPQPLQQPQINFDPVDPNLLPMPNVVYQQPPAIPVPAIPIPAIPVPAIPAPTAPPPRVPPQPLQPEEPQQPVQREYPSPPMRQEPLVVATGEEINVGTIVHVNNPAPRRSPPRPGRLRGHIRNPDGETWTPRIPCFHRPDKRGASMDSDTDAAPNSKRQKR